MSSEFALPPRTVSDVTPPTEIAQRLACLVGARFVLSGKTRTDGSHLRKLISETLLNHPLPPSAEPYAWQCFVPKKTLIGQRIEPDATKNRGQQ